MIKNFDYPTKTVVTVAEMARMVGLSRARFYQLIGNAFPHPVYGVSTRRPFYDEESQRICLEVKRRNCGVDGKPILFYARRGGAPTMGNRPKQKPKVERFAWLTDALKGLGLVSVSDQQVGLAVKSLFPSGIANKDEAQVIRQVFVYLQRQNSSDKLGR